jgi:diguanylate cyclase (GGDEF)-like protein
MDRRKRKRILIFVVVLFLTALLFLTDDLIIRIITFAVIIIYIAFIIFLRDSVRFSGGYSIAEPESDDIPDTVPTGSGIEESFKIVSKTKDVEVITEENYSPEFGVSKTTLKPPDLKERFEEIVKEELPPSVGHDEQFAFALDKMLTVISESYNAHSALFIWYNKKKEKLIIEKFKSLSSQISNRKFDLEDDILSKIVEKGEPELLTDITPTAEADVIRYYNSPQGIKSFAGVPLFYNNELVAIIAVDSKVGDAFGIETIYALGRFVRLLTMLIQIFEGKHSDTVSNQRLQGLMSLYGSDSNYEDEKSFISNLPETLKSIISYDAFAFVQYDPLNKNFLISRVLNNTSLKYVGENLPVDLGGTLVGKSIISGVPVKIDDTATGDFKRFMKSEDINFEGSFIAIPLVYEKQNYGVLCFESLKKNTYSNQDAQFLKKSLNFLAFLIYSQSSRKVLKNLTSIDVDTKALNLNSFKERLHSDLIKSDQLKVPGTLALVKIDDFLEQESLFDSDPLPKVLTTVADIILSEMTPLNLFGRIDDRLFGVYFFNCTTKTVFIWAEKLRVKIARLPIPVVTRQTTFTVSIGIASTTSKVDVDEVIYNANLALQKAVEKGGNSVRNIN